MNVHHFVPVGVSYSEAAEEDILESKVVEGRKNGKREAEIAVEFVGEWLRQHSFLKEGEEPGTIHIVSGCEAAGLEKSTEYLKIQYWEEALEENGYTAAFWDNLFNEGFEYRQENLPAIIPDDPFHRMVLHFLRDWRSRFHTYITDGEVQEERRIAVLKRQLENFVFFSRKEPFGSQWRMNSLSNRFLKQAVQGKGKEVFLRGDDGQVLKDIVGRQIVVQADKDTPLSAGDGPKPDELDKFIYMHVRKFAEDKLGRSVPNSWTMVKGSFTSKGIEVRCYAFSGSSASDKELHKMPYMWWQERGGEGAFGGSMKVFVVNVDPFQFGNNMVLGVFNALKPFVKADLERLTDHIAFEENESAQALILEGRKDMTTLDYGKYYDSVMVELNDSGKKTKKSIESVLLNKEKLSKEAVAEILGGPGDRFIWPLISVGCLNKAFTVKEEELNSTPFDEGTRTIIKKIAVNSLENLEKCLKKLPENFIQGLEKLFQESHCGEDNVIGLVLRELLSRCEVFSSAEVKLIALDQAKLEGKSFCPVCDSKVCFYSILPFLLHKLGFTCHDFDKLAPLLKQIT